ncbi:hypothetical protein RRF56_20625 [Nodosilinea sp. E11]|nr:hypothetical protein RRF56_20625 [Nodosilinea sp. E11]
MTKVLFAKFLILVLVMASACSRLPNGSAAWNSNNEIAIAIEQIFPANQPGVFTVSGTTVLPDQTPLTISAIRRITPLPSSNSTSEVAKYAILDRKSTQVKEGRWQAQLSLWQINSEGTYQENWQTVDADIDTASVSTSVEFWTTLEPRDLAQSVLSNQVDSLDDTYNSLLNFTPDGEPYLKASQSQVVAPPTNALAVSPSLSSKTPDIWAGRSTSENLDSSLRSTPQIPFSEGDNVALPQRNVLR